MEYLTLQNGIKMPMVGLGTWLAQDEEELEKALDAALEAGYRHIDTAYVYRNEAIIGKVLKKWIDSGKIERKELFIVTKLPVFAMTPEKVSQYLEISLKALQLEYLDMYLIHAPFGVDSKSVDNPLPMKDGKLVLDKNTNIQAIWKAMEEKVKLGLTKTIGLSNFEESQIQRILDVAEIKPVNLQVELHAYFQQKALCEFCKKNDITVCAYSPLASPGRKDFYEKVGLNFEPTTMLEDPVVKNIAKNHNKSAAQILLRFLTQQGIVVIPKSTNANRLKENFQILDFELSSVELKALEGIDKPDTGRTVNFEFLPGIENHPEFPKSFKLKV